MVYGGGALLDSFIPFGSAGISILQFLQKTEWAVYAAPGDKAQASPKYTSDTKFTYVQSGGQELLGLRSHKAKLETVTWYYYCDKLHIDDKGTVTYNKTWTTSSYNNPDPTAITGYGIGGIIEESVKVKIGDKDFILE